MAPKIEGTVKREPRMSVNVAQKAEKRRGEAVQSLEKLREREKKRAREEVQAECDELDKQGVVELLPAPCPAPSATRNTNSG